MRRACFAPRAIAQEEDRTARFGRPEAQPPAGREIQQPGRTADIGDHRRHGAAGDRFLGSPEQLGHIGRAHQDQRLGSQPEAHQPWPIGQTQLLGFSGQLQIDDGQPLLAEQAPGLSQRKTQDRSGIAALVGEHFLQEPPGQHRKPLRIVLHHCPRFGQRRLALDIGNSVAQRGKALLPVRQAHRPDLS